MIENKLTIKERVLQYLNFKGVSNYRFYKVTGLSNGMLDKKGAIGSDKCELIISYYPDMSLEWFLTGKGEMLIANDTDNIDDLDISNLESEVIEISRSEYAKNTIPFISIYQKYKVEKLLKNNLWETTLPTIIWQNTQRETEQNKYLAFEVSNNEMDDNSVNSIIKGDILYAQRTSNELWNLIVDKTAVLVTKDGIIVRKITAAENKEELKTITLNPMTKNQTMEVSNVIEIFTVIDLKRSYR